MRANWHFIFALFILLLLAGTATSADIYIAPWGNDGRTGTLADPRGTLQNCAGNLTAGDTCWVMNGTYIQNHTQAHMVNNGTYGNPITYKSYNGTPRFIDKQLGGQGAWIWIDGGKSNISIIGPFYVEGGDHKTDSAVPHWGYQTGITGDGNNHNIYISDVYIKNITVDGMKFSSDTINLTILNSTIEETGNHGLLVFGFSEYIKNIYIKNNTFKSIDVDHGAIDIHSWVDDVLIENNTIFNFTKMNQMYIHGSWGQPVQNNITIRYNNISGLGGGTGIYVLRVNNSNLYNNSISNINTYGIVYYMSNASNEVSIPYGGINFTISNNTITDFHGGSSLQPIYLNTIDTAGGYWIQNGLISNNLVERWDSAVMITKGYQNTSIIDMNSRSLTALPFSPDLSLNTPFSYSNGRVFSVSTQGTNMFFHYNNGTSSISWNYLGTPGIYIRNITIIPNNQEARTRVIDYDYGNSGKLFTMWVDSTNGNVVNMTAFGLKSQQDYNISMNGTVVNQTFTGGGTTIAWSNSIWDTTKSFVLSEAINISTPNVPYNLGSTHGDTWINFTWTKNGTSTDYFNIQIDGVDKTTTTNPFYNLTGLGYGAHTLNVNARNNTLVLNSSWASASASIPIPPSVWNSTNWNQTDTVSMSNTWNNCGNISLSPNPIPLHYWSADKCELDYNRSTAFNGFISSGTIYNSTGKYGSAWEFSGSGSTNVTLGNVVVGGTNITIAFWMQSNGAQDTDAGLVAKQVDLQVLSNFGVHRYGTTTSAEFIVTNSVGTAATTITNSNVFNGNWNHITALYNGSKLYWYVNGIKEANSASTTGTINTTNSNVLMIGCYDSGSGNCNTARNFRGNIDDVQIFDRELTQSEVWQIMNNSKQLTGSVKVSYNSTPYLVTNVTVNGTWVANTNTSIQYALNGSAPSGYFGTTNISQNTTWELTPQYLYTDTWAWLFGNGTGTPLISQVSYQTSETSTSPTTPSISGITTSISDTWTWINNSVNQSVVSRVQYGITGSMTSWTANQSVSDGGIETNITNLDNYTLYYYSVWAYNLSDNSYFSNSSIASFTTLNNLTSRNYTISGNINYQSNGTGISGVVISNGTNISTTNTTGYFSLNMTNGSYILTMTHLDFYTYAYNFTVIGNQTVNFSLYSNESGNLSTRVKSSFPNTVYNLTYCDVGQDADVLVIRRCLLRFNVSSYNTSWTNYSNVTTRLWFTLNDSNMNINVQVYRGTAWLKPYTDYTNSTSINPWTNIGGDWFDAIGSAQGTAPFTTKTLTGDNTSTYVSFNITDLFNGTMNGTYPYNGGYLYLLFKVDNEAPGMSKNYAAFSSFQNGSYVPELIVSTAAAITPTYTLSGNINYQNGTGIANILIGNGSNQSTTNNTGYYSLNMSNGTYLFSFYNLGFYNYSNYTTISGTTSGINFSLYDNETGDIDARAKSGIFANTSYPLLTYIDVGNDTVSTHISLFRFNISKYSATCAVWLNCTANLDLDWYDGGGSIPSTIVEAYGGYAFVRPYANWNNQTSIDPWTGNNWFDATGVIGGNKPFDSVTLSGNADNKNHSWNVTNLFYGVLNHTYANDGYVWIHLRAQNNSGLVNNYMAFPSYKNGSRIPTLNITTPTTTSSDSTPSITSVSNGTVTATSGIVNFTVNQTAIFQTQYGTTGSLGLNTTNLTTTAGSNSSTISGLSNSTKYYYSIFAFNATNSSLFSNSSIANFTTNNNVTTFMPPSPANLTCPQGNFFVNCTWESGNGNITTGFNYSINSTWVNGTNVTYLNNSVLPHGWSNLTVYAFNGSATGKLNSSSVSNNSQIANNIPVQTAIGNKKVTSNTWLNFSVTATDADGDSLTCGTNATKGTLASCNFSYLPTAAEIGIFSWYFNTSDGYGGVATETITVTVSAPEASAPTTWSHGYKLYGTYWDLRGEKGIQNGSLTNISYIQLVVSATTPENAVNGTMWLNTSTLTLDWYYNGVPRYAANGTPK